VNAPLPYAAVRPDVPLRLDVAVKIAFPYGGMTVSGLRKEYARGRLVIERIAGKDYVTLGAIEEMRKLCRLQQKGRDCGSESHDVITEAESPTRPYGSSSTENIKRAQSAAKAIVQGLKESSKAISIASTPRKPKKASVIQLKSRSPTS
jgi:hypothetical protein